MVLMLTLGIFYGVFMASVYKEIPEELSDDVETLAGALGSICNGCFRLFWASLQDKYGFKKIYSIVMIIQFVVSILLYPLLYNNIMIFF